MASKHENATAGINQHRQRFLDVETDPAKKLMPIEGFANEPLVSLEEAVKPLVGAVRDIEAKAAQAKWKCEDRPADGLTRDQSAAIILYSMQWSPAADSLFVILNKTLRDENRNQLKPWFRYLKLFLTALGRLPSSPDVVYRGVKRDLRQDYQKGQTVIWWGFTSCTRTMGFLEAEQFLGQSGARTMFHITCSSGKDIQKHSAFPGEDETLLPAARQFKVVSCLPQSNGLYMVQLKETKSPFPLLELVEEVSILRNLFLLLIRSIDRPHCPVLPSNYCKILLPGKNKLRNSRI